jgi:hypothetical protein
MKTRFLVRFNTHSELAGRHAFLSASSYHWLNYDDDKLLERWLNAQAARRGTELHAFAHEAIRLGIKLPRTSKTLNAYVNDAIGFKMQCEQILYYSENCFGTADTLMYDDRETLRIHDLKTGVNAGSMSQLKIYAALFCLEYGFRPGELEMILRIYQNDEVLEERPDVDEIAHIISKIVVFDQRITDFQQLKG